jgi:hypothetical protein
MANAMRVEIVDSVNIDAKLARIDAFVRGRVLDDAVKAAAQVVVDAAERRVPDSKKTGTRDKWSQKTKSERKGAKQLKNTIAYVIRKYDNGMKRLAVIGPRYPAGALGHLIEFGHSAVLWGRTSSKVTRVPPKPFLRPAADSTKATQSAAIDTVLRQAIESEAKKN